MDATGGKSYHNDVTDEQGELFDLVIRPSLAGGRLGEVEAVTRIRHQHLFRTHPDDRGINSRRC